MRSTCLRVPTLALAVLLAGCGGDDTNPITANTAVARLRPTAAIVFVSDAYTTKPGSPREVFAIDEDGTGLTRVTLCNSDTKHCDNIEVAPAPDGRRLAFRRATADTDGNGKIGPGDNESVIIADTQRGTEGQITLRVPSTSATGGLLLTNKLSGLDWSPLDDILVYTGNGEGSNDDLFRTIPRPDTDLTQTRNLTVSSLIRERHPRIDPTGTVAVYERTDTDSKNQIYIYNSAGSQVQVTTAGPGTETLGSYAVGGDTDPDYSPDTRSIVFRRLTTTGNGDLGTWDLMTIRTDKTNLSTIASGPLYRSAPDWGPKGIVYGEIDKATGLAQLVIIQPDGSDRRVIATLNGFDIASPRWLPKP